MVKRNPGKYAFLKQRSKILKELSGIMVLLMISLFIAGCGGGGGAKSALPAADARAVGTGITRSLKLNNYNTWHLVNDADHLNPSKLEAALDILARRDVICIGESWEYVNRVKGWTGLTPFTIKAKNPDAKVYELWDLMCKPEWDTDWEVDDPESLKDWRMQTPLTWKQINDNDWWLRDGNGNMVEEYKDSNTWILDVGKPGFKEAYLAGLLSRLKDKGYDGVFFDYWGPWIKGAFFDRQSLPMPEAYPTDADWTAAWQVFIKYICDGVHEAGYKVTGNCGTIFYSGTTEVWKYQQTLCDGTIYESWVYDWNANLLPVKEIEARIAIAQTDPLEAVIAEAALKDTDPDYDAKHIISLAAYYIALPQDPALRAKRSYGNQYNRLPVWQAPWDFDIGEPSESAIKISGKYFWSRKFSNGIVLLNCEDAESISFTLTGNYHDSSGKTLSGQIAVPPHSGMILAKNP